VYRYLLSAICRTLQVFGRRQRMPAQTETENQEHRIEIYTGLTPFPAQSVQQN